MRRGGFTLTHLTWACAILSGCMLSGCYFPEPSERRTLTSAEEARVKASLHTGADRVKPSHVINAEVEGFKLLGFDLDKTRARPGEVVTITYYIERLSAEAVDADMFVHLQGRGSGAWQNLDHTPVKGLFPLRKLRRGQVVRDVQQFRIKRGYPAGSARLHWGLFKGKRRFKIKNPKHVKHDRRDRVYLGKLQVLPPRQPPTIYAYQATAEDDFKIDGKLDEVSWKSARWTRSWLDPRGRSRSDTGSRIPFTRAKLLWTETHLYIGIYARDRDVWATLTERDSNTWEQEVVEVFIDADGDKRDYLELQVTPANVVFDARFAYRRSDLAEARAWNMSGWETATHVTGTLNKRDDRDSGYTVEMRLPLSEIPGAPSKLSAESAPWRLNMFRFDWNEAPRGRQTAAALSPPYIGDFHHLDAFATLKFK